jgi:hypothetical protein
LEPAPIVGAAPKELVLDGWIGAVKETDVEVLGDEVPVVRTTRLLVLSRKVEDVAVVLVELTVELVKVRVLICLMWMVRVSVAVEVALALPASAASARSGSRNARMKLKIFIVTMTDIEW